MFAFIYIEKEILHHPVTRTIVSSFPKTTIIPCDRYQEIFNRKGQNFRIQKQKPSLILAKKFKNFVLPTPKGYGIGGKRNFYFSHMLGCVFDCRYCFLQGMYRSANYVIFVNYEDFKEAIVEKISPNEPTTFFSGYDCDSLALESITGFLKHFLPLFEKEPAALLELRTKSTQIAFLENRTPFPNAIVAFTLSPEEVVKAYEHKTPSLAARLRAIEILQNLGWQIGLRFDPLIYMEDYKAIYSHFFRQVFEKVKTVHSATLGVFRLPKPFYKTLHKLYPEEPLLKQVQEHQGLFSYHPEIAEEMRTFCQNELFKHLEQNKLYSCEV